MKSVLYIQTIEDNNKTKLLIYQNQQAHVVELPFKPYFYSTKLLPHISNKYEETKLRPVDTLKETTLYKYEFNSIKEIKTNRVGLSEYVIAADVPYLHRLSIDKPEFFEKYFQTEPLNIMYLDIEVDSIGIFPKYDINPIISIGYAFNDEKPVVLAINKLEEGDKQILEKLNEVVFQRNPDIIVGYNINLFDIPYIFNRMSMHKISTKAWNRTKSEAFYKAFNEMKVNIQGRVIFDVIIEVFQDQTIHGISRNMKDVGKFFAIQEKIRKIDGYSDYEIIKEDVHVTRPLIGTEQLRKYNESDILLTRELSKMYLSNVLALSEQLQVPLNVMIKKTTNMLGSIFYARELKKKGIIERSKPNYISHAEIFGELIEGDYDG